MRNNTLDYWERQSIKKPQFNIFTEPYVFQAVYKGTAIPTVPCKREEVLSQLYAWEKWRKSQHSVDERVISSPTAENMGAPRSQAKQICNNLQHRCKNQHPERHDRQWGKAGSHGAAKAAAPFLLRSLPGSGSSQSWELPTCREAKLGSLAAPRLSGRHFPTSVSFCWNL